MPHLIDRGGLGLVLTGEITTLAAGSLTSLAWFRRGDLSTNDFNNGKTLWFPENATGVADDYRSIVSLNKETGAVSFDTDRSDVTIGSEAVFLIDHKIHPLWIVAAMNRALRRIFFQNEEPLSLSVDAGFQAAAVNALHVESDADGGAATGFTKVGTADSFNVFPSFINAGRLLNTAANGYVRFRVKVRRGSEVYVGWLVRTDVGTSGNGASLVLYDVTNSALLGTAVSSSEETWQYLWRRQAVTSGTAGTEDLEIRLQGIGAADDLYMNGLWVYRLNDNIMPLSTTWKNVGHEIPALTYGRFHRNTASGVEDAMSMTKHEIPRSAYKFLSTKPGANPNSIQWFTNDYFNHPIFIQGRRAHSDIEGPFTRVLTEATSADLDLMVWTTLDELFSDKRVTIPDREQRQREAAGNAHDIAGEMPIDGPAQRRQPIRWPSLRN